MGQKRDWKGGGKGRGRKGSTGRDMQRLRVRQKPYILKIRSSNDSPAQTEVGGPELFIESFTGQEISIPIQSDNMCKRFDFEEDEDETKFVDWFQTWAGLQTSAASAPTLEHIGKCATARAWTVE